MFRLEDGQKSSILIANLIKFGPTEVDFWSSN